MNITKENCLEFLRTHKVNGEKNEHVYGLFVLVEKLDGVWPDGCIDLELSEWILSYTHASDHKGPRHTKINGYSNEEFDNMMRAKSEIKRRDNAIKEWQESNALSFEDHIKKMMEFNFRRCAIVPIVRDECQSEFQIKALAQKVGGGRVAGGDIFNNAVKTIKVGMESINSPTWVGIDWSEIEKEYKANKLKTEQEEKKMRDSNEEPKEGDKAIVSNEQGFVMSYGAESIGHEVEIVKFFNHANVDLAAVEFNGSVYCFRKSMLEPVKTERQKAIEFYMGKVSAGMVKSIYKANEKYYGFAVESLIDSGYLNTKIPPVAR